MSVLTDVRLMGGDDDTVYSDFFPTPLNAAAMQALAESDSKYVRIGNVSITAAAVLAPGKRPFTVGKPGKVPDINHFFTSPATRTNAC